MQLQELLQLTLGVAPGPLQLAVHASSPHTSDAPLQVLVLPPEQVRLQLPSVAAHCMVAPAQAPLALQVTPQLWTDGH